MSTAIDTPVVAPAQSEAEALLGADRAVMARLAAEIKYQERPGKQGKTWKYVNSAICLNRIDDACGPENWSHELTLMGDIVHCRVSIRLPSGRHVTRSGMSAIVVDKPGAEKARTLADATKEAASDAFKRACKYLGIARYLWNDVGQPAYYRRFARDLAKLTKQAKQGRQPAATAPAEPTAPAVEKPGLALYREYCQAGEHAKAWADSFRRFGSQQQPPFPARIVDWDAEQVEVVRGAIQAGVL